ncbi:MAG TPA: methylenetetrahydrofolate--tRNA-(uracil(54)-C(5))-methyltransferase (FADH(2)-oxidizing) TrmFO [Candidatus Aminicenantes bacterium]|nr:methylenetetrahydrofolate--tRNA-(uracil(54)-C(5))-methyltransferase (FADH(2)-oxidizing) TrmFO [Candidatus Aminicenantes bacterium]
MIPTVQVIGAGLAGSEAALQMADRGIRVKLYEMRPQTGTEIHETPFAGEMVCSNSLGSTELHSASGLLKAELELLGSRFLQTAAQFRVPAGSSFSVDRHQLAENMESTLAAHPGIEMIREETRELPETDVPVIVATGPLTSPVFARHLTRFTQRRHLFFYDATSPIIRSDSIDFFRVFRGTRYDKGEADFLNIPLAEGNYHAFVSELVKAETVELPDFEKGIFFEACLPVEEIARRGPMSLAFGPMKPVGLKDPRTGHMPFAAIQLRRDNIRETLYQMVGFQTRLKWKEQKRIFRTLPGLEAAEFERFGRMHRNTYINAPLILDATGRARRRDSLFFAGQISGVEGYVESICSGLLAGRQMSRHLTGRPLVPLPGETACGALLDYVSSAEWKNFRPTKFSFGLLAPLELSRESRKLSKRERKEQLAQRALETLDQWIRRQEF